MATEHRQGSSPKDSPVIKPVTEKYKVGTVRMRDTRAPMRAVCGKRSNVTGEDDDENVSEEVGWVIEVQEVVLGGLGIDFDHVL